MRRAFLFVSHVLTYVLTLGAAQPSYSLAVSHTLPFQRLPRRRVGVCVRLRAHACMRARNYYYLTGREVGHSQ